MDASSRGRTSRAHVAWLVPAALASTLLLSAAAVASNYQPFYTLNSFNTFVQAGSSLQKTFTGSSGSIPFEEVTGNGFLYRVTAENLGGSAINVQLVNSPVSAITPATTFAGNKLVFTRQTPSSVISAFGGFFSMGDHDGGGGEYTAGAMTLTAFNGSTQVFSETFAVTDSGASFFGFGALDDNPITSVRLSGVSGLNLDSVYAEQVIVGVVPVPEPSTLALGGCAILAIVFARRMKPRKARAVIGVSIAILAMHVTSTMADSSVTSRPPDAAVVQGVDGRPAAPPMEPLVPSVARSL